MFALVLLLASLGQFGDEYYGSGINYGGSVGRFTRYVPIYRYRDFDANVPYFIYGESWFILGYPNPLLDPPYVRRPAYGPWILPPPPRERETGFRMW